MSSGRSSCFGTIVLISTAVIFAADLPAQVQHLNRNLAPLGSEEALMANTGTGRRASETGAYYNPATLSHIDRDRVSASGSVYLAYEGVQTPEGENGALLQARTEGLQSIPSSIALIRKWDDFTGALSLLIPQSLERRTLQTFDFGPVYAAAADDVRNEDLWIGGSGAYDVGEDFSIGATVFIIRSTGFETGFSAIVTGDSFPAPPGEEPSIVDVHRIVISQRYYSAEIWSVAASAGLLYKPFDALDLGVNVTTRSMQQYHDAELFEFSADANSGQALQTDLDYYPDLSVRYQLPLDLRFGAGIHITEDFTVLLDAGWQDGDSYTIYATFNERNVHRSENTWRFHAGMSWRILDDYTIFGGFMYNPSSIHDLAGLEDTERQDFRGGSIGLALEGERVRTTFGFTYLEGRGEAISGDVYTGTRLRIRTDYYAFLISTSYYL